MHLFYEINPHARLFKNEDEVDQRSIDLDYTLILPDKSLVVELGGLEAKVWKGLGDKKLLPDIIGEISVETGRFEQHRVEKVIQSWEQMGLVRPPISKWAEKKRTLLERLTWVQLKLPWLNKFYSFGYQLLGRFVFTTLGSSLIFALILAGLLLGLNAYFTEMIHLGNSSKLFALVVIISSMGSLSLHELGHAMAMKWAGAEILKTGFAFYLGLPVLFVDTSTIWCKSRFQRVVVAMAGVVVNAMIASSLVIATYFVDDPFLKQILWQVVFINLFHIGFSLVPFVKMDGYYVLVDMLRVPNLQQRSWGELNQVFHHPRKYNYSTKHGLMLAYGSVSMLSSGLLIVYSAGYWLRMLGMFWG